MVTAPHHLAAQAGLAVLAEGGNAIEAMIASAATIAVVYPHMNGLGGDSFWLVGRAGSDPVGIQACGRFAIGGDRAWYRVQGYSSIPSRGPLAALTVAGTVDGWQKAYELSRDHHSGRLPLARLLEPATLHTEEGFAVTRTLHENIGKKRPELQDVPGFAEVYLPQGAPPPIGACDNRVLPKRCGGWRRRVCQTSTGAIWRVRWLMISSDWAVRFGSPTWSGIRHRS